MSGAFCGVRTAPQAALPLDNPLLEDLGIRLTEVGMGQCTFELDIQARHLNRQGSLQGGVAATLLDAACGYAGLQSPALHSRRAAHVGSSLDAVHGDASTVMLTISYLSKVRTGRLRAIGNVTRSGRSLYFASAELLTQTGVLVATAQGSFKRANPTPTEV